MHFLLVNLYGQPYTKEGAPTSKAIPLKLSLDLEEMPTRNTAVSYTHLDVYKRQTSSTYPEPFVTRIREI